MRVMFSVGSSPASRLTATLHGLCEFLDDPRCRACEILEICLKRLHDDASDRRSATPREVLHKLRQVVPFTASHRRCDGQRCLPAEMLMNYLTPHDAEIPQECHSERSGESLMSRPS